MQTNKKMSKFVIVIVTALLCWQMTFKIKRVHSNKNAGCPRQIIQPRFPQTTRSDWWDERPIPTHNDVIGWSVASQALPGASRVRSRGLETRAELSCLKKFGR